MDLFYQGTFDESAELIRTDIKKFAKEKNVPIGRKKIFLYKGFPQNVGNNILTISVPFNTDKMFESKMDKALIRMLAEYNLYNYMMTYCWLLPTRASKNDIKEFSVWIHRLIDIIEPKLIVTLGEISQLSFIKRKANMFEKQGKIFHRHNCIPVYTTYDIEYFWTHSQFEDKQYKNHLKENDWKTNQAYYNRVIK